MFRRQPDNTERFSVLDAKQFDKNKLGQLSSLSYKDTNSDLTSTLVATPSLSTTSYKAEHLSSSGIKRKPVAPADSGSLQQISYELLRAKPNEITALLPPHVKVMRVEPVLRMDHLHKFGTFQSNLRQELSKLPLETLQQYVQGPMSKRPVSEMIDYLVRPHCTFHGTQQQFVPSIVQNGFVVPGTNIPGTADPLAVRCGSTYGRGIYSSHTADYALGFSGNMCLHAAPGGLFGLQLVVCATIVGRIRFVYRGDKRWEHSTAYDGCDSHIGHHGKECIVFNPAQMIPVYVIHLDWGAANLKPLHSLASTLSSQKQPQKKQSGPAIQGGQNSPGQVQTASTEQQKEKRRFKFPQFGKRKVSLEKDPNNDNNEALRQRGIMMQLGLD